MNRVNKPHITFWIITIVALLWNLSGLYQFALSTILKDQLYTTLTPEQTALFEGLPNWYLGIFGIAVTTGVLACFALLIRKKIAVLLFTISLITVIVQMAYWIFNTNVIEVYGMANAITMPIIVVFIGVLLLFYSKYASTKNWIY